MKKNAQTPMILSGLASLPAKEEEMGVVLQINFDGSRIISVHGEKIVSFVKDGFAGAKKGSKVTIEWLPDGSIKRVRKFIS